MKTPQQDRVRRVKLEAESRHPSASETLLGDREPCDPLVVNHITDVVDFHAPLSVGSDAIGDDESRPEIACTPILSGNLSVGLNVLIRQTWQWQSQMLGSPQLTLSLAPCEERTIELSTTRRRTRTDLRRSVTESTASRETSDASRSSTDVTQTTARRRSRDFATNNSLSVGTKVVDLKLGADFSIQDAVDETVAEASRSLVEETAKSAEQLRSMQEIKVEVVEEDIVRHTEKRTIHNPYRDRSLTLNFFSIMDVYDVLNLATTVEPVLRVRFETLLLDERFILANASFLEATILDKSLALELPNAVATARLRAISGPVDPQVARLVDDAFSILLDTEHGVFRDFNVVNSEEANNRFRVSVSLNAAIGPSGLGDAINNGCANSYATIVGFRHLRKKHKQAFEESQIDLDELRRRELQLCLALSEWCLPEWRSLSKAEVRNLMDNNENTEVIRRISAFLALVEGTLRPLLGGVPTRTKILDFQSEPEGEDPALSSIVEPEIDEATREADRFIDLVIRHLRCHEDYYRIGYLQNLFDATSGLSFRRFMIDLIRERIADEEEARLFIEMVDWDSAHLDGDAYVVGFRAPFKDNIPDLLNDVAENLDVAITEVGDLPNPGPFLDIGETRLQAEVPGLGTHIEPFPGNCTLPDVPELGKANFNADLTMRNC